MILEFDMYTISWQGFITDENLYAYHLEPIEETTGPLYPV